MHVSSLARKAGRGSAVGWFLVLLLICGAGAGYYLYQDNQEKKRVAQELTAERQAKEKGSEKEEGGPGTGGGAKASGAGQAGGSGKEEEGRAGTP